jgi:cell division protease FtsH
LFAARANKRVVDMEDFEKAKDKVIMGAERRSMVMTEDEKKLTAYHEAGHAIVGLLMPEHDPVHKVTIIPRGRALGVTMFLPEGDRYSHSRDYLESKLSSLFGGRLAELIIFGAQKVTTGASNDIQKATEIARNMVTKWGLSDKVGPLTLGNNDEEVFLGHSITRHKEVSETTASLVDKEVHTLIERNYDRAEKILRDNLDKLHAMAEALIKYETIGQDQIHDIMAGIPPREPTNWRSDKEAAAKAKKKAEAENQAAQETLKISDEGTASAHGTGTH